MTTPREGVRRYRGLVRSQLPQRPAPPGGGPLLDFLLASPSVTRHPVKAHTLRAAEALFRRFHDKRWSFTDCVSFAVMDSLKLDTAFTFDRNFEQYGKRRVPGKP